MSMNDGGPAFPGEQGHIPDGTWNQTWDPGMSMLDWFAGMALHGLLASGALTVPLPGHARPFNESEVSKEAYAMADAMIAERERKE